MSTNRQEKINYEKHAFSHERHLGQIKEHMKRYALLFSIKNFEIFSIVHTLFCECCINIFDIVS